MNGESKVGRPTKAVAQEESPVLVVYGLLSPTGSCQGEGSLYLSSSPGITNLGRYRFDNVDSIRKKRNTSYLGTINRGL